MLFEGGDARVANGVTVATGSKVSRGNKSTLGFGCFGPGDMYLPKLVGKVSWAWAW